MSATKVKSKKRSYDDDSEEIEKLPKKRKKSTAQESLSRHKEVHITSYLKFMVTWTCV